MPLTTLTSAAEVLVATDHDPYARWSLSRPDIEGWAGHGAVAWRFSNGHVATHGSPTAVALLLEALLTELRDGQSVTVPRGTAPLLARKFKDIAFTETDRDKREKLRSNIAQTARKLSSMIAEEGSPLVGREQQPLPAVGVAGLLLDIAIVDQLPKHAGQGLLGDLENIEQIGHRHAGAQIDEIQHPVMGPAKTLPVEQRVGIAGKIAVGEEEQAHDVEGQMRLVR